MVMKLGKVLCRMFSLAILRLDLAQNLAKIQKDGYVCSYN